MWYPIALCNIIIVTLLNGLCALLAYNWYVGAPIGLNPLVAGPIGFAFTLLVLVTISHTGVRRYYDEPE